MVCIDSYNKGKEFIVQKDANTKSLMLTWCDAKEIKQTENIWQ